MPIEIKKINTPSPTATRVQSQSKSGTQPPSSFGDFMNKDIELGFVNPWGAKQKEGFYNNLAVLLEAGLDIQATLSLILNEKKKKKEKALVQSIIDQVISGDSFSVACEQTGRFTPYEVHSIKIGEETGKLIPVLQELGSYFAKSLKYRRQLLGAISYPAFVSLFAFASVFFLLRYLVPMFTGVYQRFGGELPRLTKIVVGLSNFLASYSWIFFLSAFVAGVFLYFQREQIWFRRTSATIALNVPVLGGIIHRIYLARFCQSMYLLLSSHVPLLRALQLTSEMIALYPVQMSLREAEGKVMRGFMLYDALSAHKFYPASLLALLKVGEVSGNLGAMFSKSAEQFSNEAEQKTSMIGSLIEPFLIIFLGLVVGTILISIYLPLFQMSSTVVK